ncbi:zinc finger protein 106 isoform X2 [Clinocottus analis]
MSTVQTPQGKVGKAPAKKKKRNIKKGNNLQKIKRVYCILCRSFSLKHEILDHEHGIQHHVKLDTVLAQGSFHDCQACRASFMSLNQYAEHISTAQHKVNLKRLILKCVKPVPLDKSLSKETMSQLLKRNKTLKKEEKKAVKKKKKKQKQQSGRVENVHGPRNMTCQQGRNNAVVQNKENKMSSVEKYLYQQESTNYNKQDDGEFTSDHLPHNGAIIFGHDQESLGPSQPAQGSAQTASANEATTAAPVRDVDVSAMLRQIRRALGVREPCRADREARKQNNAEKAQSTGGSFRKYKKEATSHIISAAATSVESSEVNSPAPALHPKSSMLASDSNRQSHSREEESQEPPNSQTSLDQNPTTSFESNLNITRKVRIAHKSDKVQEGKEPGLKPTVNTMLSLSRTKNKLSLREMYEGKKKKKQERGKSMPRFGIQLPNPRSAPKSSTQAKDHDTTLSEGFHWESFTDVPSGAHWTLLPPPHQNTACNDFHTETQSDSAIQEPPEPPVTALEGVSVKEEPIFKVEPISEDENGDLRAKNSASKRKHNTYDGISGMQPSGKKKKTKSNRDNGQMDQLLAVSLREDELSHSLQELDRSLVPARNALQAAYTEVQRLMLLRQQFTAEVNHLRAQRIEILQGMQGGYAGAEKATTSSAAAPAVVHPRLSPLPSSAFPTSFSQQPHPASSISPLALPIMPVKQDILQPSTAGQASQFSSNSYTLQVAANQPVPLFPSDLQPLLLPPSPSLAAPTTAVTSLKHSASASTNSFSESPARQQTVTSVIGETQSADSDSEKDMGVNICMEVKEKEPAAEKPISTSVPQKSAATPDDEGENDSVASVEMMESCDRVVIDIDESDNEDVPNVPVHQELPQKSVSVEFISLSTQTTQPSDQKKVKPVPGKDTGECRAEDEEMSEGSFLNHTGPVHGLQIHEGRLYTCSGDNTARAYGLKNRECQAVFEGHTNKINCLVVSSFPNMINRLYTGSSDQTIRCYNIKTTKCLDQITLADRVLCLHIAWKILYAGLANGSVASYDLKNLKLLDEFECHSPRGVSCLGTSQEGARRVLLVGSYDSTISVRDAKSSLLLRSLQGHTKTVLCMKVVNDLVFSGSSDTSVHAHNIHTGELVRIYKGHGHAVTAIVILGKVMVTACLDKLVRVYELQSHDRLQVYGGHSDMVMCMAVHKSVVYTGCYDGSVQAVKLNLMKNYRCWWQNCSLIFGTPEHLLQHLVGDHSNLALQAVKCRWRGCTSFFGTKQCIQQKLSEHMQSHVENDSKVEP